MLLTSLMKPSHWFPSEYPPSSDLGLMSRPCSCNLEANSTGGFLAQTSRSLAYSETTAVASTLFLGVLASAVVCVMCLFLLAQWNPSLSSGTLLER